MLGVEAASRNRRSVRLPSRKAIQQLCKVRNKEDAVAFEFAVIRLFLGDDKTCTFPTTAAVFIELATREGFAPKRLAKEYFEHAEGIDQAGKSVEYKLLD